MRKLDRGFHTMSGGACPARVAKTAELRPGCLGPALRQAAGQQHSVDRPGTGPADRGQVIGSCSSRSSTPHVNCAERSPALQGQREIARPPIPVDCGPSGMVTKVAVECFEH